MKIVDLRDVMLINNYYYVHWGNGESGGHISGKNISVWKRSPDGRLMIYRQMAVHD
jgi:hypothetical protein